VCDLETSNEEAKARYRAVENTTKKGCNAKKTKEIYETDVSLQCSGCNANPALKKKRNDLKVLFQERDRLRLVSADNRQNP
jgi:hypothetical protein